VRHDDERRAPIAEMTGQPADRLDIQVVGRLVEQQEVVRAGQQGGQPDAAAFAT